MDTRSRHRHPVVTLLLLATLLGSSLLVPAKPALARQAWDPQNVLAEPGSAQTVGRLRFAMAGDRDGDPSTNPAADQPVPVTTAELRGRRAVLGQVLLLLEAPRDNPELNPAGTEITVRAWRASDPARTVAGQASGRTDEYGAALIMLTLPDTSVSYEYQAKAPGWQATEVRTLRFDHEHEGMAYLDSGLALQTAQRDDGLAQLTFRSPEPLDDELGSNIVTLVRLPEGSGKLTYFEPLPDIVGKLVDPYTARAEVFVPAGEYMVVAESYTRDSVRLSRAQYFTVAAYPAPGVAYVEERESYDARQELARFRTPAGALGFGFWSHGAGPGTQPVAPSNVAPAPLREIVESQRTGAWSWQTVTTTLDLDIQQDDGKKRAHLVGYQYDSVQRSYTVAVESLLPAAITDTLTLSALNQNGAVLYEERQEVVLAPGEPLKVTLRVPAAQGEPAGLRVVLDDPFREIIGTTERYIGLLEGLLPKIKQYKADLKAFVGVSIKPLSFDLLVLKAGCSFNSGCKIDPPRCPFICDNSPDVANFFSALATHFTKNIIPNIDPKKILSTGLLVLPAGEGGGEFGLEGSLTAELDLGNCPSQAEIDLLKTQISTASDQINRQIFIPANDKLKKLTEQFEFKSDPFPLSPFAVTFALIAGGLGLRFSAGLAFELKVDVSSSGTGIKLALTFKNQLKLSLVFYVQVYGIEQLKQLASEAESLLDLAKALDSVVQFTASATNAVDYLSAYFSSVGGGNGGCGSGGIGGGTGGKKGASKGGARGNPPPQAGHPDDRQDADQGDELLAARLGAAGDQQLLMEQLKRATGLNLQRAAIALRRELTALEYSQESRSAVSRDREQAELAAALERLKQDADDIAAGVKPPLPGKTVSETLLLRFNQLQDDLTKLPTRKRLDQLASAMAFANARYEGLKGQELELERELAIVLREDTVGIVDSGLSSWALGAVATFGVWPVLIDPVPGLGSTVGGGQQVNPLVAPRVLIVPSGGLYRYTYSEQARDWFERYVAGGGTLIVQAQYEADDWKLLPGGEVRGLGYLEDIFCQQASVELANDSPLLDAFDSPRPDLQVDGSFTAWPQGTQILLNRTTGNQMPAMIEYSYGEGTVIATSAYPDYYMNGLQSPDDVSFARNLFGYAYLLASGDQPITSVAPGGQVAFDLPFTNTSAYSVTGLVVADDYYASGAGESWRWAVHEGGRTRGSLFPFAPIPPGGSRTVPVLFTAPVRPGLYRSSFQAQGGGYGPAVSGPFYRVNPTNPNRIGLEVRLSSDKGSYFPGEAAEVTLTLKNNRSVARTLTLSPTLDLKEKPNTVTLAAGATASQVYHTTVDRFLRLGLVVREGGADLQRQILPLHLRPANLVLNVAQPVIPAGIAQSVPINVNGRGITPGTPLIVRAIAEGANIVATTVATTTLRLEGAGLTLPVAAAGQLALPPLPDSVRIRLDATTPVGLSAEGTMRTRAPARISNILPTPPYALGATRMSAVSVMLETGARAVDVALVASLVRNGATTISSSPVQTLSLAAGSTRTTTLAMTLPASATPASYTVVVRLMPAAAQSILLDERIMPFLVAPPALQLVPSVVDVRQTITATLDWSGSGLLPPASTAYSATLKRQSSGQVIAATSLPFTRVGFRDQLLYAVPPVPEGDIYSLELRHPALPGSAVTGLIDVNGQRLDLPLPAPLTAGQTGSIVVANTGGVDTTLAGTIQLADGARRVITTRAFDIAVPARGQGRIDLPVPARVASDFYRLTVTGRDHLNNFFTRRVPVRVDGLQPTLFSRTDRPAYLVGDPIDALNTIGGSNVLDGATLRLEVLKPAGTGATGVIWGASRADGGNSGMTPLPAVPPFSAGWHIDERVQGLPALGVGGAVISVRSGVATDFIESHDAAAGTLRWSVAVDLSAPVDDRAFALAANSSTVVALVNSGLMALDVATGAARWPLVPGSFSRLLVSEDAIVVFDGAGHQIRSLTNGALINTISTDDSTALLVDDTLIVHHKSDVGTQRGASLVLPAANDGDIAAYRTTGGGQIWDIPGTTEGQLLAASSGYVIFKPSFGNDLMALDTADGGLVRTLSPANRIDPARLMLHGDLLDYAYTPSCSGGCSDGLARIMIPSGAEDPLLSRQRIISPVATGDLVSFVDDLGTLVTVDSAGAIKETSGLGLTQNTVLSVGAAGLLAMDGSSVRSLQAAIPVASQELQVLRTDLIALTGSSPVTLTRSLTALKDDQRARGSLYLRGTLFGAEPAAVITSTERQVLATSLYPFTIGAATAALLLQPMAGEVRRDDPATPLDDAAATVQLNGRVANTTNLPAAFTVVIRGPNGFMDTRSFGVLQPGQERTWTTSHRPTTVGTQTYTASTTLAGGGTASASATVEVVRPVLTVTPALDPATVLVGDSARLSATIRNTTALPGVVLINLGGGAQTLFLPAGSERIVERSILATTPGVRALPVTVGGDLALNLSLDLTVHPNIATVTLDPLPGQIAGRPVTARLRGTNNTPLPLSTAVRTTLTRSGSTIASASTLLMTAAMATTAVNLPLGELAAGSYTLTALTLDPTTGQPVATTNTTFAVVAPKFTVTLGAILGAPVGATRTLYLTPTNTLASEATWHGRLRLEGAVAEERDLVLARGAAAPLSLDLPLEGRTGTQKVTATLLRDDGTVETSMSVEYEPLLPPAAVEIAALRADGAGPGGSAIVHITLRNPGTAGRATLTLDAFDTIREVPLLFAAGATQTLDIPVAIPVDLLTGDYQVRVAVSGASKTLDLHVTAHTIAMQIDLDRALYEPPTHTSALLTVNLNEQAGPGGSFELRVRYRTRELKRAITLVTGRQRTETFQLLLEPFSERVSVALLPRHADGSYGRVLLIDSRLVTVREDPRAVLYSDKRTYRAGETVHLTLRLDVPTNFASVMGPIEIMNRPDGSLNWVRMGVEQSLQGTYPISVTLPAVLPTGRYHFRYSYDGEERVLPIDVFGTSLQMQPLVLDRARYNPGSPIRIYAGVVNRGATPLDVTLEAFLLPKADGDALRLGTANVTLTPGTTVVTLTGSLPSNDLGVHQVRVHVRDRATGRYLAGEAASLELGAATIRALTTDHGDYALNQAGRGTLELYGSGAAKVEVRASNGAVVFTASPTLAGYATLDFTLPTATAGTEVLDATLTAGGGTARARAIYAVHDGIDTTPPVLTITTPISEVITPNLTGDLIVQGTVIDAGGVTAVVVNGVTATLDATGGTWSAHLPFTRGQQSLVVTAQDSAGNTTLVDRHVRVGPAITLELALSKTQVVIGELVTSTLTLRSTGVISGARVLDGRGIDLPGELVKAEASNGVLLTDGPIAEWRGEIGPQPVVITLVVRHTSAGKTTRRAVLDDGFDDAVYSNEVELTVIPPNTGRRVYIPIIRR